MGSDLIYGFGIMSGFTAVLFLLGIVIGERVSRQTSIALLSLSVLSVAAYLAFLWDDILLANLLPFSNLIVVGNWLPLTSGFVSGLAWKSMPGSLRRRTSYAVVLLAVGGFAMVSPILGEPPECDDSWSQELCLQTTPQSCTAACAATLLRFHSIQATEGEMADLCLTRRGTSWQGLYRGLMLKTRGTSFTVEVLRCSAEDLYQLEGTPMILVVGVPDREDVDPIYTEQYGWAKGELHSVVLTGFDELGNAQIGDPDVDWERWSPQDLQVLVRGRAVRLVRR
jgi:hypothetical protein